MVGFNRIFLILGGSEDMKSRKKKDFEDLSLKNRKERNARNRVLGSISPPAEKGNQEIFANLGGFFFI